MSSSFSSDFSFSCDGQHHTISHWRLLSTHMPHISSLFSIQNILQKYEVHLSHMWAQPRSTRLILPLATPNYGGKSQWVYKCSCFLFPKLRILGIQVDILSTSQYKLVAAQIKAASAVVHPYANFNYILSHLTCYFFLLPGSSPIWTTCTQVLISGSTFKGAQTKSGNS